MSGGSRVGPVGGSRRPVVAVALRRLDGMRSCLRGYGGCEVMPFPNVTLSRRDAVGCH